MLYMSFSLHLSVQMSMQIKFREFIISMFLDAAYAVCIVYVYFMKEHEEVT